MSLIGGRQSSPASGTGHRSLLTAHCLQQRLRCWGHYQGNVAAARRSRAAADKDKVTAYIRGYPMKCYDPSYQAAATAGRR